MRRILFLHEGSEISGIENVLAGIIDHLDRERFTAVLACPPGPFADLMISRGIEYVRFDFKMRRLKTSPRFPIRMINPFAIGQKYRESFIVARIIRQHRIDLLHTNSLSAHLAGLLAAHRAHIPILWHIHLHMPGLLYRFSLPDRIVFVSEAVRESAFPDSIPAQAITIYNGIELNRFDPAGVPSGAIRQEFGLSAEQPLVALIGHLDPIKGQRELLMAWPAVIAAYPSARLLLVGKAITERGPAYLNELQRLVQELHIEDTVIFTGYRSDIAEILAAVAIYVSFTLNEAHPLSVIEAMSMQKAIIGANSGGLPELITSGQTGVLVNNGDTAGLSEAIKTLLRNPEIGCRYGEAARRDALIRFRIEDCVAHLQALYADMLRKPSK